MKERLINTRFWSDGFIREKLNPLDRYLYLYFLTNEKTNISGIYELPKSIISWETGIEEKTLSDMLVRLKGRVEYVDGWVILVKAPKYQRTSSESVVAGIQRCLNEAPKHIVDYAFSIGYGDDTPIIPPPSHILNLTKLNLTKPNGVCFKSHTGKDIQLGVATDYVPDGFSPLQAKQAKKAMERAIGKNKTNKWSQLLFGSAWDFIKAYQNFQGESYEGNIILDEVVKNLAGYYEKGETRETMREMLVAYFGSDKAARLTISPKVAFSNDTYNSWKQGKLISAKQPKKYL